MLLRMKPVTQVGLVVAVITVLEVMGHTLTVLVMSGMPLMTVESALTTRPMVHIPLTALLN